MNVIGNLLKGNARTVKARKNVLASIALKGIDGIAYLRHQRARLT